jgi:hypothetical protein
MDTITIDGVVVPVRAITLVRRDDDCDASLFVAGHLEAGSWWDCASCHTNHLVREPLHTWVTTGLTPAGREVLFSSPLAGTGGPTACDAGSRPPATLIERIARYRPGHAGCGRSPMWIVTTTDTFAADPWRWSTTDVITLPQAFPRRPRARTTPSAGCAGSRLAGARPRAASSSAL